MGRTLTHSLTHFDSVSHSSCVSNVDISVSVELADCADCVTVVELGLRKRRHVRRRSANKNMRS